MRGSRRNNNVCRSSGTNDVSATFTCDAIAGTVNGHMGRCRAGVAVAVVPVV